MKKICHRHFKASNENNKNMGSSLWAGFLVCRFARATQGENSGFSDSSKQGDSKLRRQIQILKFIKFYPGYVWALSVMSSDGN